MGTRRKGRELALQVLYQLDVQDKLQPGPEGHAALELFWKSFARGGQHGEDDQEIADEQDRAFATALIDGVRKNLPAIDESIRKASRNWRLERMARVDRNLLRLAVYELAFEKDVPPKAAINEAIEIAKRFGTAESPAFVNGILDRCLEDLSK
jgi:N utilization substance protein B